MSPKATEGVVSHGAPTSFRGQSRICNKRLPLVKDFYRSIEGDC
jgi:hypothetical protein